MSIPPPSSGRRHTGSILVRMRRFWLGGLLVFSSVALAFAVLAYVVPPTYEASSIIEVTGDGPLDSKALAEELTKAILDSGRIEDLARHSEPGDDPLSALDRVRRAFRITPRSDRAFSISYEGRSPESTLHAGEVLLDTALEHFAGDAARHDEKQARAELEKRTRALADFVTLHPDFSPGQIAAPPGPSAEPQRPSTSRDDPTLNVLRQERTRLEEKLAAAQAEASQSPFKNPYGDEPDSDVAALGRQLAQVRLAIAAHQKAIAERNQSPRADQSPEAAGETAKKASLDSEWRSLVRAVVEAQGAPVPEAQSRPTRTVRVVEPPKLPSRPVKPNRPLVSGVGVLLGMGAGLVWAFARVNLVDRGRRRSPSARDRVATAPAAREDGSAEASVPALPEHASLEPAFAEPAGALAVAPTVALPAATDAALLPTEAMPVASPPMAVAAANRAALGPNENVAATDAAKVEPEPRANEVRSLSPPGQPHARPGLRGAGTQRGMIDPQFVKAQTGETPQSLAERVQAKPIVEVSGERRSDPAAERRDRPSSPPRSVTPPGPPSAPITQRLGTPNDVPEAQHRPSQSPSADKPDTSYSFVDRGWRATSKRASSRPPSRPAERPEPAEAQRGHQPSAAPPREEPPEPPRGALRSPVPPEPQQRNTTPPGTPRAYAESRAHSNRPPATKPGWAKPSPPGFAAVGEVWTKVAGPSEPPADEVVEPRSVPPTWNAGARDEPPSDELSALSEKIAELAQGGGCVVVGVIAERAELEAKSEVAARLASMVAEGTSRVLLMEGNFDWPAVHRQMSVSMPNFSGFSQQMHARTRKAERRPWIVLRCRPNLDVLAEGIVRSPGVLYSQQFAEAVSELRRYYRVIICDGPVAGGPDSKPLDAVTDGLVVVAPSQRALMSSLDRAAKWFGKKQLLAAVSAGSANK